MLWSVTLYLLFTTVCLFFVQSYWQLLSPLLCHSLVLWMKFAYLFFVSSWKNKQTNKQTFVPFKRMCSTLSWSLKFSAKQPSTVNRALPGDHSLSALKYLNLQKAGFYWIQINVLTVLTVNSVSCFFLDLHRTQWVSYWLYLLYLLPSWEIPHWRCGSMPR